MQDNRLSYEDVVDVEIVKEDGSVVSNVKVSGVHSIEEAINAALQKVPAATEPEAYVFRVSDLTDGTSRRYRLNAHGHVRLII